MKGKKLAALVLAGIAASTLGGMAVSAADLDEVIVNADKDKKQQEEQGTLPGGYVKYPSRSWCSWQKEYHGCSLHGN